jgi:hypothetical protein
MQERSIVEGWHLECGLWSLDFPIRDSGLDSGERKLMAALLSDGIEDYINLHMGSKTFDIRTSDIKGWVESRDEDYVFSFDSVCCSLGINPEYLRLGLERYIGTGESPNRSEINLQRKTWKRVRRPRRSAR